MTAYLDELGAKVEINGSTGENSSTPILDGGRKGLEFFRLFGPAYARYTGVDHDYRRDVERRYTGDGEIVFGPLRVDRDRFEAVARGLEDSAINLRNRGNAVFESWQGGSAESTASRLGLLVSCTHLLRGQFARLAEVIEDAVATVDRACYDKAAAVRRLYTDRVDGRGADEVAGMVDLVRRPSDRDDDEAATGNHWLTSVFRPFYESRLDRLVDACIKADERIAAAWRGLADVLDDLRADRVDRLLEPPAPAALVEDRMSASGVRPSAPPAAAGQPVAAAGPASTTTFLGGVPFFAPPVAPGSGDRERRPLDLPLAGIAWADIDMSAGDDITAIGATDDAALYNAEAEAKVAGEPADNDEPDDDEDDVW